MAAAGKERAIYSSLENISQPASPCALVQPLPFKVQLKLKYGRTLGRPADVSQYTNNRDK